MAPAPAPHRAAVRRIGATLVALLAAVAMVLAGTSSASAAVPSATAANAAAAAAVAHAQALATKPGTSAAAVTAAMAKAAVAVSTDTRTAALAGPEMTPFTNNANGRSCHWYGYCDFRMSDHNAMRLVAALAGGAALTGLCAIIAATSGGIGEVGCVVFRVILAGSAAWITYLVNTYHRGIFIRVFYTGGGYIWHQ